MAPEIYKGGGHVKYNNKADIWSLGVIFYQLNFDLKYPFSGINKEELFNNIDKAKNINFSPQGLPPNHKISEEAKDLIRRML